MRYRYIDHTADIAFEIYGDNLLKLLENATYAFYNAFVDLSKIGENKTQKIEIEGEDEEIVLYRWLNELLYLFDTQFFAAKSVEVEIMENGQIRVTGILKGGKFTPETVKVEPKAITMHKFRVERNDGELKAFVVVDI